jgi:hypothetical protein
MSALVSDRNNLDQAIHAGRIFDGGKTHHSKVFDLTSAGLNVACHVFGEVL